MKKIRFDSNGKKLSGTLFIHEKNKNGRAVLFIIGWSSSQNRYFQYAKALCELGFVCMTFDLAGHGESEGDLSKISRKELLQNCIDAYDCLRNLEGADSEKINVVGSSFGGYMATLLCSQRKVKSLALAVPQNYPDKLFDKPKVNLQGSTLKVWRSKKKKVDETRSLKSLNSFDGNVLIVQSEFDEYVSDQTIKNYINAVNDKEKLTYVFMDGAPHSLKKQEDRKRFEDILKKWLKDNE